MLFDFVISFEVRDFVNDITNWREGVKWEFGEEEEEGESRDVRERERDCNRVEMVVVDWD